MNADKCFFGHGHATCSPFLLCAGFVLIPYSIFAWAIQLFFANTKLIEYMALGKAVVANDHPEQRLVIAASGSGICTRYAEEPFADAIIRLLKHPNQAVEMGIKGKRYVAEHRIYSKIADLVVYADDPGAERADPLHYHFVSSCRDLSLLLEENHSVEPIVSGYESRHSKRSQYTIP